MFIALWARDIFSFLIYLYCVLIKITKNNATWVIQNDKQYAYFM